MRARALIVIRTGSRTTISRTVAHTQEPTVENPDPGGRADARLRPLSGEAHRRRHRATSSRRSSRTVTTSLGGAVRVKGPGDARWREEPLDDLGNDRFGGAFIGRPPGPLAVRRHRLDRPGRHLAGRAPPQGRGGQDDLSGELAEGAVLLGRELAHGRRGARGSRPASRSRRDDLRPQLAVDVDRVLARFGAWYELFPRSWGGFAGVAAVLPGPRRLGFDVVYLPPIHPIGVTNRKGRNNALERRTPATSGSPWAIGSDARRPRRHRSDARHRGRTSTR